MNGYWVSRIYRAGAVEEKIKFFCPGQADRRHTRKGKQTEKKACQNQSQAVRRLARLINANFSGGDAVLGLTYSRAGMARLKRKAAKAEDCSEDELDGEQLRMAAQHELALCLRRVKRQLEKDGLEQVKYIGITSDRNGVSRRRVRLHHHAVCSAHAVQAFKKAWRKWGHVHVSELSYSQRDYTPVAVYLCRQVAKAENEKTFTRTRNLYEPEPVDRVVYTGAEIRPPAGAYLVERAAYCGQFGGQYIRYIVAAGYAEERRE